MRLLHTSTLQLEDFPADKIPAYAILSHTWGDNEVGFADMERGTAEAKAGYHKIRHSCEKAVSDKHYYIWIDTCCINQSSSADLSEAINSMYSWYQRARVCYAYLADVSAHVSPREPSSEFAESRWFKRGWTLQELIGPSHLVFFSHDWIEVGTKSDLSDILSEITGISVGILTGTKDLESASVAKRMSWVNERETTRPEDIAYCLMGLFNVNMPMLYGEEEKAFTRLQEEIMKHSDDESLFAWTDKDAPSTSHSGLLVRHAKNFADSGNVMPYHDQRSAPFSMSNKGLRIEFPLSPHEGDYIAALNCPAPPEYENFLGIRLKCVSSEDNQYTRVMPQTFYEVAVRGSMKTV
ncbi:hypothetical protein B0A49_03082, partial [Cryomyces minteri]